MPNVIISSKIYPLFGRHVRVLPIPDLTGEVCGVMRFADHFRYIVRLDGVDITREFFSDQLEAM